MSEDRESGVLPPTGVALLLAAIFTAAGCAIVYELLIGSTSAYFLGNSVRQYSLTIGFFLFAMGVGSWLSRLFATELLAAFILVEVWLGLVGGAAVAALYLLYAYTEHFQYGMLLLVLVIGTLIGLEVPLLTRILRSGGPLRTTLASVLSADYLGSLVAAVAFPYVLLPLLGGLHAAIVTGLANVAVGAAVLTVLRRRLGDRSRGLAVHCASVGVLLLLLLAFSGPLVTRWESSLYQGRIVHSEQSAYQKIVLTRRGEHLRLLLDEHLQFASVDEYRYHEALVHPAMAMAQRPQRVLIIGGGDGLTAREVLRYPEVDHVDLIDLDPSVTNLARRNEYLTRLNDNALNRPRLRITNEDGFVFLQRDHEPYGVILIDLPDPRDEALAKLYSVEAYRMCRRLLSPGGVLATQATSPYYARRAYWCIAAALEEAGYHVYPYHTLVPSFGEWGFHLAATVPVEIERPTFRVPRRFIDAVLFRTMLHFDADMERVPVEANRLDRPVLAQYYRQDWEQWQ